MVGVLPDFLFSKPKSASQVKASKTPIRRAPHVAHLYWKVGGGWQCQDERCRDFKERKPTKDVMTATEKFVVVLRG